MKNFNRSIVAVIFALAFQACGNSVHINGLGSGLLANSGPLDCKLYDAVPSESPSSMTYSAFYLTSYLETFSPIAQFFTTHFDLASTSTASIPTLPAPYNYLIDYAGIICKGTLTVSTASSDYMMMVASAESDLYDLKIDNVSRGPSPFPLEAGPHAFSLAFRRSPYQPTIQLQLMWNNGTGMPTTVVPASAFAN